MTSVTTRVRGLAAWQPRRRSLELLEKVQAVLAEYRAYLPLTLRQVFYRLVGAHGFDKTEQTYGRLGECLNRARRASMVPFHSIRDDGITLCESIAWEDGGEWLRATVASAKLFRLDRQESQPRRLMFAVEAAGMVPQVRHIAEPFGIAVQSSGGFDSLSAKYKLANILGEWDAVEVLHIGDHDPSGVHLYLSMADDVGTIAEDLGLDTDIQFSRLAVTPAQVRQLGLPTAPAKATDRRSFDGETVQVEAIPPDTLADIIRTAINDRLDRDAYAAVLAREERIREKLTERLASLAADLGGQQ
jgi:hypothetical protein